MLASPSNSETCVAPVTLLLGIDTCGPSGSVALGRLARGAVEILAQIELEGRSYSSTLVAAVGDLLAGAGVKLKDLGGIVAVSGPGSFTGVRVGLSAVKGLAEATLIPVVAVSRLEVLAMKAGVAYAALDAHRHEVFLRMGLAKELLAGEQELAAIDPAPLRVAVCDEAAVALLRASWPAVELVQLAAPTAADALRLGIAHVVLGEFADVALLDGHYLRRSDAEIFGEPGSGSPTKGMSTPSEVQIRPMVRADLEPVMAIAHSLPQAPHWTLAAYLTALDPHFEPRRISLVAQDSASGETLGFAVASLVDGQAELESIAVAAEGQRRGVARHLFAVLVEKIRAAQVTEVILEVRASNHPALGLYRSLGFVETGRRPRYYADPQEDAVLMSLRIG